MQTNPVNLAAEETRAASVRQKPEVALGSAVKAWLCGGGWDVYEEVRPWVKWGPVADLVATRGREVWVIECKMGLTLAVLAQAAYWPATRRSVAVPYASLGRHGARTARGSAERVQKFGLEVCGKFGIGVIEVGRGGRVYETVNAPLQRSFRRQATKIRASLNEGHQRSAPAGSAEGLRWSPYREMVAQVRRIVEEAGQQGVTLRQIRARLKADGQVTDAGLLERLGSALREYESVEVEGGWCVVEEGADGREARYTASQGLAGSS